MVTRLPAGRKRLRGFTIIELIVTIAVIGILAAVALPAFSHMTAVSRAKTTATNIHLALLQARSTATKFNANATITPVSGNWASGWSIAYTDGFGVVRVVAKESKLPDGVSVTAPSTVVYASSGRSPATNIDVKATAGKYEECRRVSVNTGGNPSVKPLACS